MKGGIYFGLVVAATIMFGGAAAGQSGDAPEIRKSVTILQDATLGGMLIEQGKYDAVITGGDDATLVLRRDKRELARVRVRRTELAAPSKYDRVDVRSTEAGKQVVAVYFKGERGTFAVLDDQGVALADKP
jgi:hypothetical protein